jgi:hypothetical protein
MSYIKNYIRTFVRNQFILAIFILGIALSFISIRPLYHFYFGGYSTAVAATVEKTREIETTNSGGRVNKSYVIKYTFEHDGKKYSSERYRYSHDTPRDVLQYKPGDTLTALINPDNPENAVIVNEYTWTNILGSVLGLVLIFSSLIIHGRMAPYMVI